MRETVGSCVLRLDTKLPIRRCLSRFRELEIGGAEIRQSARLEGLKTPCAASPDHRAFPRAKWGATPS